MATAFELSMAAGLAVALINGLFAWRAGRSSWAVARTVVGWLLAFAAAGLVGPIVARWLLINVF